MTDTDSPSPPPKVDPETLVLRGSPGRVVRFRRSVVIGIAALGSSLLVGTAWFALQPAAVRIVAADDGQDRALRKEPADALANAPKTYGDVPKLGPALPGDLGRPILAHQRAIAAQSPDPGADVAAQAAEAERQRAASELRTARESAIMLQVGAARTPAPLAAPVDSAAPAPATEWASAPIATDDPNAQQRKADFMAARDGSADTNPHRLTNPSSPWTINAGSIIAASLITGLNSDLPGLVTAQVTEHVHDSLTGRTVLIPQGSRLIGSYDSVVAFGQKRALVVWQRIIRPDGSSLRIDNVPATDTAGYAGLADKVDTHGWQLLKGVALSTLLGVGSELSFGSAESDLVRAIRESAQQSGARAGDQIVTRNLSVQPTIRVRPGWPLRLVVHKDLTIPPWPDAGG
jgi:type IV secretion system protein VirB10